MKMDGETMIREYPRDNYTAAGLPIRDDRERQLLTDQLSCGIQSAYISLVNRRFCVSLSFKCPIPDG